MTYQEAIERKNKLNKASYYKDGSEYIVLISPLEDEELYEFVQKVHSAGPAIDPREYSTNKEFAVIGVPKTPFAMFTFEYL